MKKLFFFLVFVVILCSTAKAQTLEYSTKNYGGGYSLKVIQPTIDNFLTLCDMSSYQFTTCMQKYGYFPTEDSGNPISYWNGSIDNFAYAKAVNTFEYYTTSGWVAYLVQKEYIYPNNSMSSFISTLAPYYYARETAIYSDTPSDVYKISRSGKVYGIFVTDLGSSFIIHARIFAN